MKLFITETCVVKGGKIKERGETYETGDVPRKEDKEAYDLIASGRAIEERSPEVAVVKEQIAKEEKAKADSKKTKGEK